jgi:hypothetical protein
MSITTTVTKTLKTYSKHQRVVNCENLFQNFASTSDEQFSSSNNSSEKAKLEEANQEIKTKRGRRVASKAPETASKQRNNSQKGRAASAKEAEIAAVTTTKPTKKRQNLGEKPTVQHEPKKRSKKLDENKENSQQQEMPKEPIKLFEMSEDSNSSSGRLASNAIKKETKSKSEKKLSVSASATQIVDSMVSTCNVTREKKSNDSTLKSILKPSSRVTNLKETPDTQSQQAVKKAKSKRLVKISAEITCRNDNLTSLKCDNRKKHAASTSTPTGTRRKPLKAPQNVSIICKN